jgi:hypothetical protein
MAGGRWQVSGFRWQAEWHKHNKKNTEHFYKIIRSKTIFEPPKFFTQSKLRQGRLLGEERFYNHSRWSLE